MKDETLGKAVRSVPLKVAIVGLGEMARGVHLPVFARMPGVAVVAVADVDASRRREALTMVPGARGFESVVAMLNEGTCDALVVATPPGDHVASGLAALARGVHVYVEKPLAARADEARALVEAWRRSGRVGMAGFNYRLNPLLVAARDAIRQGEIGQVTGIQSAFSLAPRQLPTWKQTRDGGGGVLLDLATHHIDLGRYLLGADVVDARAHIESRRSEADTADLWLTFSNGAEMRSFFSLCDEEQDWLNIHGTAGRLVIDRYRLWRVRLGRSAVRSWRTTPLVARTELWRRVSPGRDPSYRAALEAFVTAIRTGAPPPVDLGDGLRAVEVVEMAESRPHAASETGHPKVGR